MIGAHGAGRLCLVACPIRVGLPCYWFGVVIGVTLVGIGVFLSLPREVTTTLLWLPFLPCVLRYIVTHDLSLGFSETGWPFLLPQPELSLARLQSARDDT